MLKKLRSPLGCLLMSSLLFMGTLVGVFILALRHRGDPYLAEVALADGVHQLRLLNVQEGPFDYTWNPPLFQSFLPIPGPRVPPITIHLSGLDRQNHRPGHTFLFRTVDQSGRYAAPTGGWLEFDFVESSGYVFTDPIGMPDYPHWGTYALTRSALPRRDKELRIRIKNRFVSTAKLVEMTAPNPCYRGDFPTWMAETLPAEKTKGQLKVQLNSFEWQYDRLNPEFRATSSDLGWDNAQFEYVLEDATGNMGESLSPFEPVWKVKTKVYRSTSAELPPDTRTKLEKLPTLAPGTVQALDQKLQIGGHEFRVLCVAGAGMVRESDGQFTAKPMDDPEKAQSSSFGSVNGKSSMQITLPNPSVWIELPKEFPQDQHLVVQYTRDGQRTACSLGHYGSSDRILLVAEWPVDASTGVIDLTIALSLPEEFEFFVTPPTGARDKWTKPEPEK